DGAEGQRLPQRVAFGQVARDAFDLREMADRRLDRFLVSSDLLVVRLLQELRRGFARLEQTFGQSCRMRLQRTEPVGRQPAAIFDPEAHKIDDTDDDDAGDPKQEDLRAQAKMDVAGQQGLAKDLHAHVPSNRSVLETPPSYGKLV